MGEDEDEKSVVQSQSGWMWRESAEEGEQSKGAERNDANHFSSN
jgi:hypothetical protein